MNVFATDRDETGIRSLRDALLMLLADDMNKIRAQGGTGADRPGDRGPDDAGLSPERGENGSAEGRG